MWYLMENIQKAYSLSDRLIRAISSWQSVVVGENDDVESLLDEGVDVNRLHGTLLPLHCACMVGDPSTVQLLIEHGARVNAIDGYERAALHYAAERSVDCLDTLLLHGAEVNVRDGNDDTGLHWAAFKNNHQCVQTLLQNGAQVNARDYNNDTPLSWAAMKGNLESVKVLLEYNAKVDTKNYNGLTPLTRAASILAAGLNTDKDDACLELVLKAFGQFDLRDPQGQLPNLIGRDNRLREMLMPYCCNVRPLQQLCRFVARTHMGDGFMTNRVPKLPLPQQLQDYILLQW